jgi:hypothetical protein
MRHAHEIAGGWATCHLANLDSRLTARWRPPGVKVRVRRVLRTDRSSPIPPRRFSILKQAWHPFVRIVILGR